MKKIQILLLILILTACSKETSNLTSLQTIQEKKTMVVGFTNYPPLGFKDENQEIVGLDIDIATAVAERLGVSVTFQYIDWDNKMFELNNHNIDMIWNGFTITTEREKEVNFSKPYMHNQIVILSLSTRPISTIKDLKGLDVGVETQSSGQIAIEKHPIIDDINELQKYTNISEALLALNAKTVDAIVVDVTFAGYLSQQNPNQYHVSDASFDSELYAIGFRKDEDDSLKDAIDAIIDELILSKEAQEISEKWLGKDMIKR